MIPAVIMTRRRRRDRINSIRSPLSPPRSADERFRPLMKPLPLVRPLPLLRPVVGKKRFPLVWPGSAGSPSPLVAPVPLVSPEPLTIPRPPLMTPVFGRFPARASRPVLNRAGPRRAAPAPFPLMRPLPFMRPFPSTSPLVGFERTRGVLRRSFEKRSFLAERGAPGSRFFALRGVRFRPAPSFSSGPASDGVMRPKRLEKRSLKVGFDFVPSSGSGRAPAARAPRARPPAPSFAS